MFYPDHHAFAWFATITQVKHQTWIGGGKQAEARGRKTGPAKEVLNLTYQHGGGISGESVRPASQGIILWSRTKSYLSRKNPFGMVGRWNRAIRAPG